MRTKRPDKFTGPIDLKLNKNVEWEVINFKPITYAGFVLLKILSIDKLSTD